MTFETLKDLHLWKIIVIMYSGKEHEGVITSQEFVPGSFKIIQEITLVGETEVVKIDCSEIKEVRKVEKVM